MRSAVKRIVAIFCQDTRQLDQGSGFVAESTVRCSVAQEGLRFESCLIVYRKLVRCMCAGVGNSDFQRCTRREDHDCYINRVHVADGAEKRKPHVNNTSRSRKDYRNSIRTASVCFYVSSTQEANQKGRQGSRVAFVFPAICSFSCPSRDESLSMVTIPFSPSLLHIIRKLPPLCCRSRKDWCVALAAGEDVPEVHLAWCCRRLAEMQLLGEALPSMLANAGTGADVCFKISLFCSGQVRIDGD